MERRRITVVVCAIAAVLIGIGVFVLLSRDDSRVDTQLARLQELAERLDEGDLTLIAPDRLPPGLIDERSVTTAGDVMPEAFEAIRQRFIRFAVHCVVVEQLPMPPGDEGFNTNTDATRAEIDHHVEQLGALIEPDASRSERIWVVWGEEWDTYSFYDRESCLLADGSDA